MTTETGHVLLLLVTIVSNFITFLLSRRARDADASHKESDAALNEAKAAKIIEDTSAELIVRMSADMRRMQQEMDDLRSKLMHAESRVQQLEKEKRGQQVEINKLGTALMAAQARVAELERLNDKKGSGAESQTDTPPMVI